MQRYLGPVALFICTFVAVSGGAQVHIRVNQVGYGPEDTKIALVMSDERLQGSFSVWPVGGRQRAYRGRIEPAEGDGWGPFNYYYQLDFTE